LVKVVIFFISNRWLKSKVDENSVARLAVAQ